MVGATRRVAQYRAARRAAPTFRNDEVAAQRRRWTFCETIKPAFLIDIAAKRKLYFSFKKSFANQFL
jgi:hypothetical protein